MRRTMIFATMGATALTIALGVGAAVATAGPTPPTPPTPNDMTTMMDIANDGHMPNAATHMMAMMDGTDMGDTMSARGMSSMHDSVHDGLTGDASPHRSMTPGSMGSPSTTRSSHSEHHPGRQS